jgi:hypothetical protein
MRGGKIVDVVSFEVTSFSAGGKLRWVIGWLPSQQQSYEVVRVIKVIFKRPNTYGIVCTSNQKDFSPTTTSTLKI